MCFLISFCFPLRIFCPVCDDILAAFMMMFFFLYNGFNSLCKAYIYNILLDNCKQISHQICLIFEITIFPYIDIVIHGRRLHFHDIWRFVFKGYQLCGCYNIWHAL